MGQKIREDKIGTLSHNAGVIGLTNSYLTIGGQQYSTGALSRTISDDVTMTANTRYMIYVVLVSGVPALRISANVNSVGPAGFSAWRLVGAFITNAASSWGAFINIEGKPCSEEFFVSAIVVGATTTPPTKGGTVPADRIMVSVNGEKAKIRMEYRQTAAGTGGSGDYTFAIPYSMNSNKVFFDPTVEGATKWSGISVIGSGQAEASTENAVCAVIPFDATKVRLMGITPTATGAVGSSFCNTFAQNPASLSMEFEVAIDGWSDTPLKDL